MGEHQLLLGVLLLLHLLLLPHGGHFWEEIHYSEVVTFDLTLLLLCHLNRKTRRKLRSHYTSCMSSHYLLILTKIQVLILLSKKTARWCALVSCIVESQLLCTKFQLSTFSVKQAQYNFKIFCKLQFLTYSQSTLSQCKSHALNVEISLFFYHSDFTWNQFWLF